MKRVVLFSLKREMVLNQTVLKKEDSQMAAVRLDSLSIYRNSSVA